MPTLELSDQELSALVNILAQTTGFPWMVTNPLLVKLLALRPPPHQFVPIQQPMQERPNGGAAHFDAQRGTAGTERPAWGRPAADDAAAAAARGPAA